MSRRTAAAMAVFALGLSALTACGKADHADDVPTGSASPSDVGNPAGDPNGGSGTSSPSYQIAKASEQSSFAGTMPDGTNYNLVFFRGKLVPATTALASVDPATATYEDGVSTVLGSACEVTSEDAAFPFAISAANNTTGFDPATIKAVMGLYKLDSQDDETGMDPFKPNEVDIEITLGGETICNRDNGQAGTNTAQHINFNELAGGESHLHTGWVILKDVKSPKHPDGSYELYKDYKMTVTTTSSIDPKGFDKIDGFTGEFTPRKTYDGQGNKVTVGGELPLVK